MKTIYDDNGDWQVQQALDLCYVEITYTKLTGYLSFFAVNLTRACDTTNPLGSVLGRYLLATGLMLMKFLGLELQPHARFLCPKWRKQEVGINNPHNEDEME